MFGAKYSTCDAGFLGYYFCNTFLINSVKEGVKQFTVSAFPFLGTPVAIRVVGGKGSRGVGKMLSFNFKFPII